MNQTGTKNWYVLYTKPRHEKKVAERLTGAGYQRLLPFTKSRSQMVGSHQGGGRASV